MAAGGARHGAEAPPPRARGAGAALIALGLVLGLAFGLACAWLARAVAARYAVSPPQRPAIVVAVVGAVGAGVGFVLARAGLGGAHALFLLATNTALAGLLASAAAIDAEHMILPNELTIGAAILALASSPLRSVGAVDALLGALTGLAATWLPYVLYRALRGRSGMGLGDTKFAIAAGAWHGVLGVVLVLLLGAVQSLLFAGVLRLLRRDPGLPASVAAELDALRARAAAGDAEAAEALAADPMAADAPAGLLGMRLPLGPFLVLGCLEVLFLRRFFLALLGPT